MNNHWHTNYRADQEGPTVFRYFLFPHGRFSQTDAARRALECSEPFVVTPAVGPEPQGPRLQLSNPNVMVTAFKPSEDGKGLIVRLFGASSTSERVELNWGGPAPRAAWVSNASERPLERVDGVVEVPARTIVTLRFEPL